MSAPSIVYFGDSLSDNGNLYAFGEGILPDDVRDAISGPTGAVSDGPTHTAYTGDILGLDEANYAVAAAEATGTQTLEELLIESGFEDDLLVPVEDPALDVDINLGGQIDRFAEDYSGEDLSQTAAFILIGGNDFQNLDFGSPTILQDAFALIDEIVSAQIDAALALLAEGVGTVWLSELPVAEFFAEAQGFTPVELSLSQLAFDAFNAELAQAVADLAAEGHDARVAPTAAVTEAIAEDPTGFGLLAPYGDTILYSNTTDTYDPDQIAFYDDIHPSTATHGIIGAFTAHLLSEGVAILGNDGESEAIQIQTNAVAFMLDGDDTVLASGQGGVVAFGGGGDDVLVGSCGSDLLSGGDGDDVLRGRAGDDVLNAGIGDDVARGMRGDDVLIDSLGNDVLRGGRDDDTFIFTDASLLGGADNGFNVIGGGEGYDTLYLVVELVPAGTAVEDLLDTLGLRVRNVEEVVVLDGRSALSCFAGEAWYDDADVWGLI